MTREELKGKQTPGAIAVFNLTDVFTNTNSKGIGDVQTCDCDVHRAVFDTDIEIPLRQKEANASLYAEAHNVANRTGMWPEDMEARIKELEAALKVVLSACSLEAAKPGPAFCEELREALNSAEHILNKKS